MILQRHAIEFFSSLYTIDAYSPGPFPVCGRFSKLDSSLLSDLAADVTFEEVRRSLFSMSPLKAPGLMASIPSLPS